LFDPAAKGLHQDGNSRPTRTDRVVINAREQENVLTIACALPKTADISSAGYCCQPGMCRR